MTCIDKTQAVKRLRDDACDFLELGCGPHKRHFYAIGMGKLDYAGVDPVGDVFEVLRSLPSNCVRVVHAYHFLEHVSDLIALLEETAQVLMPCGWLDVEVPHFTNPYFYSDPTHSKFFGLYAFSCLAKDELLRRRAPQYGVAPCFELVDVRLEFDSQYPIRAMIKRTMGPLFNLTRWLQEFHEENLCYALPCYQLRFSLPRLP